MSGKSTRVVIVVEVEGLEEAARRVPDVEIITAYDRASALRRAADAEVLCVARFDSELFSAAANVRWVHAMMGGVERVLFPEFVESPIPLTCIKQCFGMPGAQHAMASMLASSSRMIDHWWLRLRKTVDCRVGRELRGNTLGIIGFGNIGRTLAELAKPFGMRVIAMARNPRAQAAPADELLGPNQLPELLRQSDFVVLAVPLTSQTRGLIGAEQLKMMKPSAWFIDISGRPAIVNEDAVIAALRQSVIAGADLQFATAPPPESPIWKMENLIMSQWSANSEEEGRCSNEVFAENLRRYRQNRPLIGLVDKKSGY
jgi:phosphoglycerate dehydrogenase-like enzyme